MYKRHAVHRMCIGPTSYESMTELELRSCSLYRPTAVMPATRGRTDLDAAV